jgi:hypothetical protein
MENFFDLLNVISHKKHGSSIDEADKAVSFGGLVVSMLASGTQDGGFAPN